MVNIISAFRPSDNGASGSIADSLKSIGQSIWGDEAKNEGYRQNALKTQRENAAREAGAEALRRGDATETLAQGFRGGVSAPDATGLLAGYYANKYGAKAPQTQNALVGSRLPWGSTPQGTAEAEANRMAIENARTDRAATTQEAIANRDRDAADRRNQNTPVTTYDNGQPIITRQSEAYGHAGAPLHKDQVVGGILQNSLRPGAPPAEAQGTDAMPPAAPSTGSPFTGLSPDVRHLAGLPTGLQQFEDPRTRQIYLSTDGGQSVTVGNHRIPVENSGLHPIGNEQAVTQTQANQSRETAGQPLPPAPGQYSQAARDAGTTSGLKSPLQHELNATAGVLGLGEIQPNTNRARENLDQLTQSTRALIAAAPGRTALTDRRWADELLPHPGWFGMTGINAAQQQNRVGSLTSHLRQLYADVQQEAMDVNTPPAQLAQLTQYLSHLRQALHMWEAPPQGGASQGAQPPGAPAAPATPQGNLPTMASPADAARLPRGTQFRDPQGNVRTVP